jgi:hypothetical protein
LTAGAPARILACETGREQHAVVKIGIGVPTIAELDQIGRLREIV